MNQLPAPTNGDGPPQVPIDIGEPIIGETEALKALEEHGLVNLPPGHLTSLRAIGAYIHGTGTLKTQRGGVMVNQQRLDSAMRIIHAEIVAIGASKGQKGRLNSLTRLCTTLGYLSTKLTDSQHLMMELEGGRAAIDPNTSAEATVRSFMPGQTVKPGSTLVIGKEIHMHGNGQEPPAKK